MTEEANRWFDSADVVTKIPRLVWKTELRKDLHELCTFLKDMGREPGNPIMDVRHPRQILACRVDCENGSRLCSG